MKNKKSGIRIIGLLLTVVLIFVFLGCSSNNSTSSNSASNVPKTKVFTDMLGRKVTLSTNIKRIVLVRTMDIYMLSSILGKELDTKLVAVGESFKSTDIDGYNMFSKVYKNLDKMTALGSVYDDAINVESVVNLNPDIIIVDKQFCNKNCIQKMISTGLPVVIMDNNSDPFYGPGKSIKMLGKMLGKESKADEMVEYANQKTDAVLQRVQKVISSGTKKPVLYWECGNVAPDKIGQTDGDVKTSWGYVWDKLGADNISIGVTGQPLNVEKVLASNPDIIIIGGANWNPTDNIMRLGFFATQQSANEHLRLYTKRAGWSDLNAIKNGRLYALHYNLYGRPYGFAGVEEMAKMLYPAKFNDLDPDKDIQEFFSKYMEMPYSGIQWAQWNK
ncbi:ABC transporter substrate-binding protein [Clostridium luticellarii]|jgi:iron complex transport system substrate-binding protein|uniref:ABC transporter substrate-binding protein n=1 Tax=Clostridium luticellarii TaxID=1691940 RepID=UPI0023564D2D|nr:ABC transporter substrate-binding protein [Clostridium luticellarii]MCI1969067.1 ABC transporter substrate-binding protein [Clostridium luticellarii]